MTIVQIEIDTISEKGSRVRSRILGDLLGAELTEEKARLIKHEINIAHKINDLVRMGMTMTGGAVPCDESGKPILTDTEGNLVREAKPE